MNNFVRPEPQACVYVTMCVQYKLLLQWYNIAHPLLQITDNCKREYCYQWVDYLCNISLRLLTYQNYSVHVYVTIYVFSVL